MIGIAEFADAEQLDLVGPWEVFTASTHLQQQDGRQPDEVLLIGGSTEPVRCAKGMRVVPGTVRGEHPPLDVVLVPGDPARPYAADV